MKKVIVGISVVLVGLATSCATTKTTIEKEEKLTTIVGTSWQLADATRTKLPTMNVIEKNKISGNGSCNNYSAQIQMSEDGSFSVKNIASTRMLCEKNATESNFFNMLRKINRYEATSKQLELYKNDLLLLKFNRIP